jgi:hypothetical protein
MKDSITNRIIIGKSIGLVSGIAVFLMLRLMGATIDLKLGIGLMFFYIFLGALIALIGMFDRHPIFKFKMHWWLTGIAIGLVFHLMLILISYDQLAIMLQQMDIFGMISPWWSLIDGAIIGLIMAFVETKFAGEGNIPAK